MLKHLLLVGLCCHFHLIFAQKKPDIPQKPTRHTLKWGIGMGYEDGIYLTTKIPCLGVAYEYRLAKRFSANAHIFSYYRAYKDFPTLSNLPYFDRFMDSNSPFMTAADNQAIKDRGIKSLDYTTFKIFSLPMDLSLSFYPIATKHHRLGFNAGIGMTYESMTYFREQLPMDIKISSKNYDGELYFNMHTYYRNFSIGETFKFLYEYHFKHYLIGTRFGSYNLYGFTNNQPVWESSLYFGLKF